MPTFLTRLRSSRHPKPTRIDDLRVTPAPTTPDASLTVSLTPPSPETAFKNKIHPDLNTLFASTEDDPFRAHIGLKPSRCPATAESSKQTREGGGTSGKGEGSAEVEYVLNGRKSDGNMLPSSFPYASQKGASTLGSDEKLYISDLKDDFVRTRRRNRSNEETPNRYSFDEHARPSGGVPALSWSPKADASSGPSETSASSRSNHAVQTSSGAQDSIFCSPSPQTFGHPTPLLPTPSASPGLPFPSFHSPPFQSTPKARAQRFASMREPDSGSSSRFNSAVLSPISSTFSRVIKSRTSRPEAPTVFTDPTNELGERGRTRTRSRAGTDTSQKPRRRKSAEWNAQAASAGLAADPSQSQDYGWPAEVSREILRLSLGKQAGVQAKDVSVTRTTRVSSDSAAATRDRAISAPSNTRNRGTHVSHEKMHANSGAKPMRPKEKRFLSSSQSFSLLRPSLSSTTAPTGSAGFASPATQDVTQPADPLQKSKNRPPLPPDDSVDVDARSLQTSAPVNSEGRMIQHVRTDSENQNKWDSLQPESGDGYVEGSAVRPSTPIKQSASTSTYHTAGSSSFLHAPSLSVIAPTPRGSPGRSREESAADSELGEGLKVPTPPKSDKSKGKRKAEDSEEGSPPGSRGTKGKKTTFAERPQRNSNSSHAPSSFQSFQSQKSRKRVRLSSPATPDQSRPGSAQNASHLSSVSSRASSRSAALNSHIQRPTSKMSPPRPVSRASRASRAMSASGVSSSGAGPRPKRSLSQSSIPLSAILSPRAPSVDRLSTFYMRDPQKPPSPRDVGWSLRFRSPDDVGSPLQAWSFWFGFLFPLLWWIASLWRLPKTRMVGTDTEKAITVDDPHIEREARTWRLRCRVASVLFFFTYAPVIILLAIFAPRS